MEKIYNAFFVNSARPISAWFIIISGILGATMTIVIGLPQAIHLFKTKKAGLVKYYSFWTFFAGILGWIFLGAFDPNQKILILVIANIICGFIYIFVLWLIYRYAEDSKRQKYQWVSFGVALGSMILITVLAILGLTLNLKNNELVQTVVAQIIPILTTFAFLPQILKSIETKDFSGMSIGMVIVFVLANVFWCTYWISFILNAEAQPQYMSAITWQVLSLLLYVAVLIMMIVLEKKKKMKFNPSNEEEPFVQLNGE